MTIGKAIEILNQLISPEPAIDTPRYYDALRLGIEALKVFQRSRQRRGQLSDYTLLGETKED